MIKVYIHTVGKAKESWLQEALAEYETRLGPRMRIEWHLARTDAELEKQLASLPGYIALDPRGRALTSPEFQLTTSSAHFAIGGPSGLSDIARSRAAALWSLSPLTFTHQMCRLILLEQLYRGLEIERGSPYHR